MWYYIPIRWTTVHYGAEFTTILEYKCDVYHFVALIRSIRAYFPAPNMASLTRVMQVLRLVLCAEAPLLQLLLTYQKLLY
jgi:hypothetical protein